MKRDTRVDHVWVVDDDRTIRWVLERALKRANIEVTSFDSASEVIKALRRESPSALISDIRMPGMDGLLLLERVKSEYPDLPVIIMTAHSDLDNAVSAYRSGAFEYLPKPFDVDEAVALARRACLLNRKQAPVTHLQALETPEIVGEAAAMQEVFRAIGRLSRSNITVLINGISCTRPAPS
jgi:two-component system nitrogen regulation response regulator GlnG